MTTPRKLVSARTHWAEFCKAHPELGMTGSSHSWIWFSRTHAERLYASGAMFKSSSRRLLLDPAIFDPLAYAMLTGQEAKQ